MESYKYLAKNIGLLALSNFGTKLITFLLVPLYTNILTTSEYGEYDFLNATISLLVPILTLNIMESTLRYTLSKEDNVNDIFSISMKYFLIAILVMLAFIGINYVTDIFPIIHDYWGLFFLLFITNAFGGIIVSFARGIDQIIDVSISSIISTLTIVGLNIILLVIFKMGIVGFLWATIIGSLSQAAYLCIKIKCWKYVRFNVENKSLEKEMLHYCRPLIANSVAWWFNSAADRYIVIWFCGMAENGIYSVGYKIPSILNIFQSIFNQAWTLSAVRDFDPEDKDGFFKKMYGLYNCLMVLMCSILIILDRFIAKILYANEFFLAWKYVPFLLISIVFGAVSGYVGGIFSAVKKSSLYAQSTIVGAAVNIILNFTLVQYMGALGAAVSTGISYMVVWAMRVIVLRKYINMKINYVRDCISYGILWIQSILLVMYQKETILLYVIQFVLLIIILFLYYGELNHVYEMIRDKIRRR